MSATRFRRRRWPWLAGAAALAALVVADRSGWLLVRRPDDMTQYHGVAAAVTRVIDGDTIEIDRGDPMHATPVTVVRLWGVDAPELASGARPAEPHAIEARDLARALAGNGPVSLRLEPHRTRGAFGRVLAHVQLADGSSLNEALLEAGLARADDRWPHALVGRYAQLERAARRRGLGIWSTPATPAPAAGPGSG